MDLNEMKTAWTEQSAQLEKTVQINTQLVQLLKTEKLQKTAFHLKIEPWFDIIAGIIVIFFLSTFFATEVWTGPYIFPAAVLHIVSILYIISGAYQLVQISELDFGAPVTEVQKQLLLIKKLRVRFITAILCASPILGIAAFLVIMKGLFGFDLVPHLPANWVWINVALASIALAIAVYISRYHSDFIAKNSIIRSMANGLAGSSFQKIEKQLNELEQFKRS